jgi:hypothetical protein
LKDVATPPNFFSFDELNRESLWRTTGETSTPRPETESETTDTHESYETVPEIEIRTTRMTSNTEDVTMTVEEKPRPTELKLKQPVSFNGKRDELDNFVQDILLYLGVNEDIYNNDRKKIGYALTFMDKGDAKSWKTAFLQNATTQTGLNLGTWTNFLNKLKGDFKPYDADEIVGRWREQTTTNANGALATNTETRRRSTACD